MLCSLLTPKAQDDSDTKEHTAPNDDANLGSWRQIILTVPLHVFLVFARGLEALGGSRP